MVDKASLKESLKIRKKKMKANKNRSEKEVYVNDFKLRSLHIHILGIVIICFGLLVAITHLLVGNHPCLFRRHCYLLLPTNACSQRGCRKMLTFDIPSQTAVNG